MQTSIQAHRIFAALASALALVGVAPSVYAQSADWMTWPSTYTHDPVAGQRIDQYALPEEPRAQVRTDFQRSGMRHYRSTLQAGQSSDNLHIVEQWGQQVVPYEQWRFPYRPYGVPYDQWGPQAPYGIFNGQFGFQGGYAPYPPVGYPYPGSPQPMPRPEVGSSMNGPGHLNGGGRQPYPRYPGNTGRVPPGYGYPGGGYPGGGYPGFGHPGYGIPGYGYPGPAGFPLQPQYQGQPWFDGNYPEAPPLRRW